MPNNYEKIITSERLRIRKQKEGSLEDAMLSDKTRILTSSAFRRLQTKAQVFSLEKNASVRSRLTHTLEVALYGELIAVKTFNLLLLKKSIDEQYRYPFYKVVENACLLHDVGNPPFGHLGEFAIRDWFERHTKSVFGN